MWVLGKVVGKEEKKVNDLANSCGSKGFFPVLSVEVEFSPISMIAFFPSVHTPVRSHTLQH